MSDENFVNPVFNLFEKAVDDSSIHQYEYVQYNTVDGKDITNFTGSVHKIVTKDLDSYLLPQKAYLDIVLRISEATDGVLTNDTCQLHSNSMSIFNKCSYFINSVPIEEVEYPVLTTTVRNLLEYSDDFLRKQGPAQWFYLADGTAALDVSDPRTDRIQTGANTSKKVRLLIPLSRIFGFMDAYGAAMRGLEHRLELVREQRASTFVWGPDTNAASKVILDEMSVWIPKLLPSPAAERAFLQSIKNNESAIVNYESWNGYRQVQQPSDLLTWQIGASSRKPKYVFCMFQNAERLDATGKANPNEKDVDPSVFDNLDMKAIELRVNSKRFPYERYRVDFSAATAAKSSEYTRLYKDWLRIMGKDAEYDNGSLVSYDGYRTTYPIVAFDLSSDHSLFENTQTNYIEVEVTWGTTPAQRYYSEAVIVWDREIKLSSDGESLSLIRP